MSDIRIKKERKRKRRKKRKREIIMQELLLRSVDSHLDG